MAKLHITASNTKALMRIRAALRINPGASIISATDDPCSIDVAGDLAKSETLSCLRVAFPKDYASGWYVND